MVDAQPAMAMSPEVRLTVSLASSVSLSPSHVFRAGQVFLEKLFSKALQIPLGQGHGKPTVDLLKQLWLAVVLNESALVPSQEFVSKL